MAIDFTGITNNNEFYTNHYLNAILEKDLKALFKEWTRQEKEEGVRPPYSRLKGLSRDYSLMRSRLERTKNSAEKLELQREFFQKLLPVLGYRFDPDLKELEDEAFIPVISEVKKPNGIPELWIIDALDATGENVDPLDLSLCKCQYPNEETINEELLKLRLEEIVSKHIFRISEPPRWVILISDAQILLIDRSKWNEKRSLRFELPEILGRQESSTLKATAALLHRDSICPDEGLSLLDTLDENSHKHAFAVSEDLKYALRECIELLGNEAVWYMREKLHEKRYKRDLDQQLTIECLRYMYRLLFLFYIEARPELGYAPMKSEAYRKGYSLDTLRDLELVKLTTEESKNGYFIHESIQLLFRIIYEGFPTDKKCVQIQRALLDSEAIDPRDFGFSLKKKDIFLIKPLKSHLFDPARTPLLNRVKFRNYILQQVIRLMSLTRPKNRREKRGRISYAQLGINQLGAVYEGLLSYRGFFAETDLYEVKKAGSKLDELETAYFVKPEDLEKYTEDERVYNDDGTLRMYPKGTFIYRLAGRDRQKSASYYTPEVLTRCLVKYALKELLKDKTADEILKLTICEPAMGSAAFLNEAVNQLAEAYLDRKQKETGQTISHDNYKREKQKVKMYLADNNVFGVDLNPVAVELAEVSLWLNSIYKGAYVPWFGMQLVTGNSLIGARRQVFPSSLLSKNSNHRWLDEVPTRIIPGTKRPQDTVYHFLLPDRGMADYTDRVVKEMAKDEIEKIKKWNQEFAKPFSDVEIERLLALSDAVDRLWESHIRNQRRVRKDTSDTIDIFGQKPSKRPKTTTTQWKDRVFSEEILSVGERASSPYRRLKLAMDYWCALWFWPIEKADLLPTREEFLFELSLILEGDVFETYAQPVQKSFLLGQTAVQLYMKWFEEPGIVNVDHLCKKSERLGLVAKLADKYRFLHWELEFADVFADKGGFDLVLGNPPWIKVEWNEGGVMGDHEPLFVLKKFSASKLAEMRKETIERLELRSDYLSAYEEAEAMQNFLNAYQNYPVLRGVQTNLFKCFLPQAWMIGKEEGVAAFLHPEGIYDDPKGGKFREEVYKRLRYHFQFQNQLMLFPIGHRERYSVNIYKNEVSKSFVTIANLFHPSTVYACFSHSGLGPVPGIKNDENKWDMRGHKARIIEVTDKELELFARLYDSEGTPPLQARLPALHSQQLISVLEKFAAHPRRLGDLSGQFFSTEMWHETNSQRDGTIRRETRFPKDPSELILSGPHFFVGTPFYKTPRAKCTEKAHYDVLDLTELPDDYLPRTNYVPACDPEEYVRRTPRVPWGDKKPVTEFYRHINRRDVSPSAERTMIPAIIAPGSSHIFTVFSTVFKNNRMLINFSSICASVPIDYFIKTTGKAHILKELVDLLPILETEFFCSYMFNRYLSLICLAIKYAHLWEECWREDFKADHWTKSDPRLPNSFFKNLTPTWNRNCALRTDYARRQALVEIDVLAAMALGLTLEELKTIYRVQFPVLRMYEGDTWYDQKGRIVFTNSKGLTGVGFSRPEWNKIKDMKSGTVERTIIDDTLPGGPRERTIVYYAPFDRCDREKDYETAWAEFEKRL